MWAGSLGDRHGFGHLQPITHASPSPRVFSQLVPYPPNLEQNDKDFDEKAQKTPYPNLAICGWVRVLPPKSRFGDLYQRGGWCFARNQKGLGDSLDVPRKGVVAVRRLAHGPHTLVPAMPG